MITNNLVSKQTVVEALDHLQAGEISTIHNFWSMYMSPEQHAEFSDSYVLFESCVRRRYNLITGGTL